jgi:hypothetical protein
VKRGVYISALINSDLHFDEKLSKRLKTTSVLNKATVYKDTCDVEICSSAFLNSALDGLSRQHHAPAALLGG